MHQNCDDDNADFSEDGNVSADGSGPVSRSSVTHVAYIVSKFDDVKRDLVREIGFEGILDLPQITKVDRKFTLWLLTKVDPEKRCIVVNNQCITDVIDFEVARIMGIPCGSREICSLDCSDKKSKLEFIQHFIGSTEPESNSLTAAENNVTAQYDSLMTMKDKDNFKVSFVVWVMGHLLAPTKKHNVGGDRFWGALLAPDEINQFNWATYVIEELMIAAKDVQNAIKQKKPVNAISGCSILLQILYFESIHMGTLNRPGGISPRVKVYDGKSLSLMIAADKASSATESGNATWGSTVRRFQEVPNESFHLASHTRVAGFDTNIGTENHIIKDFGTYVRDNFGEKVSTAQSVALSWFHARCTHHHQQLRLIIQQDTIDLVRKLFGSPAVSMPAVPPQPIPCSGKARQAHSEPSRALMYGRTIQNNKRGAESSATFYKRRASKKHIVSPRHYALPETLLSGMSWSDEHEVVDEISDTEHHSRTLSHKRAIDMPSTGGDIEVPLFDLGIEFNTETQTDSGAPLMPHGHTEAGVQVGEKTPSDTLTPNVLDTNNGVLCSPDLNDTCVGSSTPVSVFNALSGTPPSAKSTQAPIFTTPEQMIKSSTTSPGTLTKIMAEGDLVERMTRFEDSPDINMKPWDHEYVDSPIPKRNVDTPKLAKSPWSYNYSHRTPPRDIVEKLFEDVSLISPSLLNRVWLVHTSPRHIELDGSWIHKTFIMQKSLSYDVCDLAVRRLKQLDGMMYSDSTHPHWRHILESEFAMFALAAEAPYNRKSIVEQFIGSSIQYRIEDCRMLVVPAFILLNWSCYFFDFKDKCVHVIDPLYKKEQSELFKELHHPSVSKVAASLSNCFEMFFGNWHHNMLGWDIVFVEPPILDATPDETGLLTLMCIRQFDGAKIRLVNRESFFYFKKLMLYELMCLSENHVKTPVNITITIDD